MGYIVKNTTQDNDSNSLEIGNNVYISKTKEKGIIVLKIGNLYQVKTEDGKVRSYLADELEGQINE
ncbi:unknown [Clostridium sp. CAG:451]|nr:unknown [Clostridium sp. CAG:451]